MKLWKEMARWGWREWLTAALVVTVLGFAVGIGRGLAEQWVTL